MSRTYTLNATLYGGRTTNRNMYMSTMQPWSGGKRAGCWKDGSTEYWGAVAFVFGSGDLANVRGKTIESLNLSVNCSSTFAYSEELIYNVKQYQDVTKFNIQDYAHEVTVPRYGTIPTIDVTVFGVPDYGYVIGGYYRTYAYCDVTGGTLTVVTAETSKTITYNGNGGTSPAASVVWGEGSWDGVVTITIPTRTGYSFKEWNTQANGNGTAYQPGDDITLTNDITLYAQWTALKSVLGSVPNSDIGSNVAVSWTNYGQFTNKIRFIFGSKDTGEMSASGSSYTYSIPQSWNDELPNSVSGTATVYLYTYNQNTLLGSDSKTFKVTVPSSIVPSIGSVSATKINETQLVNDWNIYLQEFSKTKIKASSCQAGRGASIVSYKFLGQNLNKVVNSSNASANATSGVIEVSGSLTYTVTITDSRGRTAQKSVTISVESYSVPVIKNVSAVRADSNGDENPVTGTSIKVSVNFVWTSIRTNALDSTLSYKKQTSSNYTVARTGVVVNTDYIIANVAEIASSYNVKLEIQDSLGGSATFVVIVPPIVGIAFGLKNDRARFGGPVEKAGFQVDWPSEFNDTVDVTKRRCSATLSAPGWYRVCDVMFGADGPAKGSFGFVVVFNIVRRGSSTSAESHAITYRAVNNGNGKFIGEESVGYYNNQPGVSKIRYTYDVDGNGHFDIYYELSAANNVSVFFDVYVTLGSRSAFVASSLASVADAQTGELAIYDFVTIGAREISCLNLSATGMVSGQGFFDLLLGVGNEIASNTDCDMLTAEGKYTCGSYSIASTLSNSPFSAAFGMLVFRVATGDRKVQIAIPNSTTIVIKIRHYNGSTWTTWKTITPT